MKDGWAEKQVARGGRGGREGWEEKGQRGRKEPSANLLTGLAWSLDDQVSEQMV